MLWTSLPIGLWLLSHVLGGIGCIGSACAVAASSMIAANRGAMILGWVIRFVLSRLTPKHTAKR